MTAYHLLPLKCKTHSLFPPFPPLSPLQLVPKATHSKILDQSFGSARVQCTAAGRSPEDCRDPRVLEGILGKYYPSKLRRRDRGRKGKKCLCLSSWYCIGTRTFFLKRIESRPNVFTSVLTTFSSISSTCFSSKLKQRCNGTRVALPASSSLSPRP